VGGRAHQIPQLKAIAERTGARFLHHDGGIEHGSSLLPGLISRADVLCFPVDCISHDAVATIKRLCRHLAKPYQPLADYLAKQLGVPVKLEIVADYAGVIEGQRSGQVHIAYYSPASYSRAYVTGVKAEPFAER